MGLVRRGVHLVVAQREVQRYAANNTRLSAQEAGSFIRKRRRHPRSMQNSVNRLVPVQQATMVDYADAPSSAFFLIASLNAPNDFFTSPSYIFCINPTNSPENSSPCTSWHPSAVSSTTK